MSCVKIKIWNLHAEVVGHEGIEPFEHGMTVVSGGH